MKYNLYVSEWKNIKMSNKSSDWCVRRWEIVFMRYNFIMSFPDCLRGFPGGTGVKEPTCQ